MLNVQLYRTNLWANSTYNRIWNESKIHTVTEFLTVLNEHTTTWIIEIVSQIIDIAQHGIERTTTSETQRLIYFSSNVFEMEPSENTNAQVLERGATGIWLGKEKGEWIVIGEE
jgi:hypothetical protein